MVGITVSATDEDGDELLYIFTPESGTVSSGGGASKIWTAPSSPGEYSVELKVSDRNGGEVTDTRSITVTEAVTQVTGVVKFREGE